jgi:hypothetical protein
MYPPPHMTCILLLGCSTNAVVSAVSTPIHAPPPALSAAGEAKQGPERMGRGEGEREDVGMVTGLSDDEERARQSRLMRSVARFLKEVSGGAGGGAGDSGAGTGGGVGRIGAHMRQRPPRLLLRNSAEEEAVSIASMVSITHTRTHTHTHVATHTHTRGRKNCNLIPKS